MNLAYTSELTLEQYALLESLLTPPSATGRPRSVSMMWVIQAILYVLVSGCAWYLLPKEYPPYSTVYYYFRKWRDDGSWKRIHDHLVEWVRVDADRHSSPTAASLDSQTVSTAVMVHQAVGYDGGKKIKGRKRLTKNAIGYLSWFAFGSMVASLEKIFCTGSSIPSVGF